MCGICGFAGKMSSYVGKIGLVNMLNVIKHRGPDEEGTYNSKNIGLGIRRLSIVDIEEGHQPIHNETKKIYVIFNGEIYNYKTLREDMMKKGHNFYTNSDTEVIVHLYEEYGKDFVNYLNGMFAIAVWDSRKNMVILTRDRIGIKPLYYWIKNNTLVFASEVKSLLNCRIVDSDVNVNVLGSYLAYRFIPGEQTMFKDIYKLLPGHMLIYDMKNVTKKKYWDITIGNNSSQYELKDYARNVKEIFSQSIKSRVENESSVGIFLSGGLDSTIVLSEASKVCSNIKTFSVRFVKPELSINKMEYDEIDYSKKVADIYGSEHYDYTINNREVIDDIEKIINYMDEPISDPTSIPLFYVSRLAKEYSKIVLSGEGADEIFGGYGIYKEPQAINKYLKLPKYIRKDFIEKFYSYLPIKRGKDFIIRANKTVENRYKGVGLTFRGEEISDILSPDMSNYMVDKGIDEYIDSIYKIGCNLDDEEKMMFFDQKIWLPEDVLIKSDKMSMAHSIELRVPFLDHKLVNYAATIPFSLKCKNNIEKYILRESYRNEIPRFVLDRKKAGFPVPISALLSKEFKELTSDILLSQRFIERGYFNREFIKQLLNKNSSNNSYVGRQIWLLITFELWHRIFIDGSKANNMNSALN